MENKKVPRVIRNLDSTRRVHFNDKVLLTTPEVFEQRWNICKKCNQLDDYGCNVSGFFMVRQCRLKAAACPLGKWSINYRMDDGKNN